MEKTLGQKLFEATRRPHQRGDWSLITHDEKGHFERSAQKFIEMLAPVQPQTHCTSCADGTHGETPSAVAKPCPEAATHTPCPVGYVAWHEWAEEKSRTHEQRKCPACGRWVVWAPRPQGDAVSAVTP